MGDAIVPLRNLGRRYGEFEALRDVTLSLQAGECVALTDFCSLFWRCG